jgi:HD superfamily phosphodiesterase
MLTPARAGQVVLEIGEGSMDLDRDEIAALMEEYGRSWGINHTRRLLHLTSIIGEGQRYSSEAVWVAAHLHDWGGYSKRAQKDVDHAVRSAQLAETLLTERGCEPALQELVLECIRLHHTGGQIEALNPCS